MKTVKLFVTAIVLLALAACGDKSRFKTAVEYNDYIIGQQSKILEKMDRFSESISNASFEESTARLDELVKQCTSSIDSVKVMEEYNGNTALRDQAVILFQFYKSISEKEYKEMLEIVNKDVLEDTDSRRLDEIDGDITKRENELDATFRKVQQEFADANNMILQ